MTRVEYDGDNPLQLANEIEAALAKYGSGSDHRMCKAIHFFEGEQRLIAACLRCAKAAKQSPSSTHGVATREEIEKYLKQLKKTQDRRVTGSGFWVQEDRLSFQGYSRRPVTPRAGGHNSRALPQGDGSSQAARKYRAAQWRAERSWAT